jgi:hypothetical protein
MLKVDLVLARVVRDSALHRNAMGGQNREGHRGLAGRPILGGVRLKAQELSGEVSRLSLELLYGKQAVSVVCGSVIERPGCDLVWGNAARAGWLSGEEEDTVTLIHPPPYTLPQRGSLTHQARG